MLYFSSPDSPEHIEEFKRISTDKPKLVLLDTPIIMNEFFSEEVVGVIEDYLEGMLEREKTEQQQIRLVPDVFSLPSKDFVEHLRSYYPPKQM